MIFAPHINDIQKLLLNGHEVGLAMGRKKLLNKVTKHATNELIYRF